jgi:hypothetical protein
VLVRDPKGRCEPLGLVSTDLSLEARLGLFSLVALLVQRRPAWQGIFRQSAWQKKARPTFADGLAHVRRALWQQLGFWLSERAGDRQKSSELLCAHVAELLAYFT